MEDHYQELFEWIEDHALSRSTTNLSLAFADAIPLVEIINIHIPELVQLDDYSPKNCVSENLINWVAVNSKLLNRININLSKNQMERLARAEPGVIEEILLKIKDHLFVYKTLRSEGLSLPGTETEFIPTNGEVSQEALHYAEAKLEKKIQKFLSLSKQVASMESKIKKELEQMNDLNDQIEVFAKQASKPESG